MKIVHTPDLRTHQCDDVVSRVEHAFATHFDTSTEIRKRRSLGFRTDRNSWVRIEIRDPARLDGQGWGTECALVVQDVALPQWHQGISWFDHDRQVLWRADETAYITDRPIKSGGILTTHPKLSESWWTTFNASLDALCQHTTPRIAVSQARITEVIHRIFPDVDARVEEWTAAHADLAWANLTAPHCYFLDWEGWGTAARGWDAASLWSESLAVPALADRVHQERQADLESRAGKVSRLYRCVQLLVAPAGYAGPLLEPAQVAAAELLTDLRA